MQVRTISNLKYSLQPIKMKLVYSRNFFEVINFIDHFERIALSAPFIKFIIQLLIPLPPIPLLEMLSY